MDICHFILIDKIYQFLAKDLTERVLNPSFRNDDVPIPMHYEFEHSTNYSDMIIFYDAANLHYILDIKIKNKSGIIVDNFEIKVASIEIEEFIKNN